MVSDKTESIAAFLEKDKIRNINMLRFMEGYPVQTAERIGNSVLLRGVSDCRWVYVSSPDEEELKCVAMRLGRDDTMFAAVEDWMVPILVMGRTLDWRLSMTRLVLPEDATLPEAPQGAIAPLSADEADYIYEHSLYRNVTRPDYIRSRILKGPSAAVRDSGRLVAWLMTQDDGSIGLLHVLDDYRRKGHAYELTVYLIGEIRVQGRIPFVHVEETNTKSMGLALKVGFRRDRRLCWFKIGQSGSGDYC